MSERKISSLKAKAQRLKRKGSFHKALDLIEKVLIMSPDFIDAMNLKAQILYNLKNYDEFFQTSFNMNLLKLQKEGIIPTEINSPDSWIQEAITLINSGQYDRALLCIDQAKYKSPIVNKAGLSSMNHHENAKIYFFTAVTLFHMQEKYDIGISFFEKANKLNPDLIIPNNIKEKYNDYLSNRSGEGVNMLFPLTVSNLRAVIPFQDKILVSTYASASAKQWFGNEQRTYTWKTHLIISDYGIAFNGADPACNQAVIYTPFRFIVHVRRSGRFSISPQAEGLNIKVVVQAIRDPQAKSRKEPKFQYIDELNLQSLKKLREEEMLKRAVIKLNSFEILPSYREYIKNFEWIPKALYKKAKKDIKKN